MLVVEVRDETYLVNPRFDVLYVVKLLVLVRDPTRSEVVERAC